jgi:hypothetical protein
MPIREGSFSDMGDMGDVGDVGEAGEIGEVVEEGEVVVGEWGGSLVRNCSLSGI